VNPAAIPGGHLDTIAARRRWARHPQQTLGVARAAYLRRPDDDRLWRADDEFEPPRREVLVAALREPLPAVDEPLAAEDRPAYDEDGPA